MRSWDHLSSSPATQQRWFSCLYPSVCRYLFIDPGRMKDWVDLGGRIYQDGLPVHRRSPIQVLTGSDVEYVDQDQRAITKPGHHWALQRCLCVYGNEMWDRIGNNLAYIGDISKILASNRDFRGRVIEWSQSNSTTTWKNSQNKTANI